MDNKALMLTLGAAVVVGGLGVSLYNAQQGTQELATGLLLPQLSDNATAVDRIKITSGGNTLVVESHKAGDKWVIDSLDGYSANVEPLSELINRLKDAKKIEAKTAKPEQFHHLGLRDISDEQSKAVMVTVSAGDKSYQVLLGDNAKQGSGQYVRLGGDNQSWLIDKAIDKPDKAEDWVETKLFDFEQKDIQMLKYSGQFSYELSKKDAEQENYSLTPIDAGYKLKYDSITSAAARSIASLKFEALTPQAQLNDFTPAQSIDVSFFDDKGQLTLQLAKVGDNHYLQLKGDNPLWQKWAYQIGEYQYNQLVKDPKDYLEEDKPVAADANVSNEVLEENEIQQ